MQEQNAQRYYPLLLPDAQLEFVGLDVDEETPEFVVVGDMGAVSGAAAVGTLVMLLLLLMGMLFVMVLLFFGRTMFVRCVAVTMLLLLALIRLSS